LPTITATVIARIVISSVIIRSIIIPGVLVASCVIGIIVGRVSAVVIVVWSAFHAVVIVGTHFFFGVGMLKKRLRVRLLSRRECQLRSARYSKNTQRQTEQEQKKFSHRRGAPSLEAQRLSISEYVIARLRDLNFTSRRRRAMLARV